MTTLAARLPGAQHLFLLRELVKRDYQSRYAGSALGFVWSLVQPLWQLVLFTLIFSVILNFSLAGERTDSFAIFLFCGLIPWMAVSEGIGRSATAITDNSSLVKKMSFPSEILVLTVVVGALVQSAIAATLFLVVLAVLGQLSISSLPLLLVALPPQIAMTLGLGLTLAAAHVFVRDTAQFLNMFLTAWFYFTPIVYSLSFTKSERVVELINWNPLTVLVDLYRAALLGGPVSFDLPLLRLFIFALLLLALGIWFFGRLKSSFADEV